MAFDPKEGLVDMSLFGRPAWSGASAGVREASPGVAGTGWPASKYRPGGLRTRQAQADLEETRKDGCGRRMARVIGWAAGVCCRRWLAGGGVG
jgi:hypothetical protein